MQSKLLTIMLSITITTAPIQSARADPITEVIKAAITKIIKAMDLAVQRLQNETIKLQNIQKALENAMTKLKLQEISEWAQKQQDLFNTYYEELNTVRNIISQYREVKQMTQAQVNLVKEYRNIISLFRQDRHFTAANLKTMEQVYSGLLEETTKNIDLIITVVKSFTLKMSDGERLELINHATAAINKTIARFRTFNQQNIMFSIERAKDEQEQLRIKAYYNIP